MYLCPIAKELRNLGEEMKRAVAEHRLRDAMDAQNKIGELASKNIEQIAVALDNNA